MILLKHILSQKSFYGQEVGSTWQFAYYIVLVFSPYKNPLACKSQADRRLWKAPLVSQLFPFLWAEPHHAGVSLSCEYRSWLGDFSKGRSRITAWVARFLWKRSWRTVPVARCITNVSVYFIQLSKNSGESPHRLSCVKTECRTGKGEFNKSCPAVPAIHLVCLSQIHKSSSRELP